MLQLTLAPGQELVLRCRVQAAGELALLAVHRRLWQRGVKRGSMACEGGVQGVWRVKKSTIECPGTLASVVLLGNTSDDLGTGIVVTQIEVRRPCLTFLAYTVGAHIFNGPGSYTFRSLPDCLHSNYQWSAPLRVVTSHHASPFSSEFREQVRIMLAPPPLLHEPCKQLQQRCPQLLYCL